MDEGLIEIFETVILIFALVRCAKFTVESKIRQGGYFWLAAVLILLAIIRRELSFLMNFDDLHILGYDYDAIEDSILFGMYVCILGQLIYARTYVINVLKVIPKEVYLGVIILMEIQYIGEHLNLPPIPHWVGFLMEEFSENMVYIIGLCQLGVFDLSYFEKKLVANPKTKYRYLSTHND